MIDFLVSCGVALLSGLGVGSGGLLVVSGVATAVLMKLVRN